MMNYFCQKSIRKNCKQPGCKKADLLATGCLQGGQPMADLIEFATSAKLQFGLS